MSSRCCMVRVFGAGGNSEPVRCSQIPYNEDDDFCYLCSKYANGLTEPTYKENEADDEDAVGITRLYNHFTRETYWVRPDNQESN